MKVEISSDAFMLSRFCRMSLEELLESIEYYGMARSETDWTLDVIDKSKFTVFMLQYGTLIKKISYE
jgi:hypothetical protein